MDDRRGSAVNTSDQVAVSKSSHHTTGTCECGAWSRRYTALPPTMYLVSTQRPVTLGAVRGSRFLPAFAGFAEVPFPRS